MLPVQVFWFDLIIQFVLIWFDLVDMANMYLKTDCWNRDLVDGLKEQPNKTNLLKRSPSTDLQYTGSAQILNIIHSVMSRFW